MLNIKNKASYKTTLISDSSILFTNTYIKNSPYGSNISIVSTLYSILSIA